MTDTIDDVLDEGTQSGGVPQIVKTMAIISYVGNALWGILFLIVALAINSFKGMFVNRLEGAVSTDQVMMIIIISCLIVLVTCIVSIMGAVKMTKGKKSGFYMYAAANGIWTILLIIGGTPQGIVLGLISLGFIVAFGMQLKNFPA